MICETYSEESTRVGRLPCGVCLPDLHLKLSYQMASIQTRWWESWSSTVTATRPPAT